MEPVGLYAFAFGNSSESQYYLSRGHMSIERFSDWFRFRARLLPSQTAAVSSQAAFSFDYLQHYDSNLLWSICTSQFL